MYLGDATIRRNRLGPSVAAAAAEQRDRDQRALVEAAVGDGRVPEHRRGFWLAQLRRDPTAEHWLAQLAASTAPRWPGE